jgi:FKBP-type peptidyl-prolyl cis-trans isomerase 2
MRALLLVPTLVLLASPAAALESIELKNGKIYEAREVRVRDGQMYIELNTKLPGQTLGFSIPVEKVLPEFVYYAWAAQIRKDDVKGHVELADWAKRQGLFIQAWRQYEAAAEHDAEMKSVLPELQKKVNEEAATWMFKTAWRLMEEDDVVRARLLAEKLLMVHPDSAEGPRTKELLKIIAERETFLEEKKRKAAIEKRAKKQKREIDKIITRVRRGDRYAARASSDRPGTADRRLSYAVNAYARGADELTELLDAIEVDALRRGVEGLIDEIDGRYVQANLRLGDLRFVGGDSLGALDAVHSVLALDPKNKAATGLRERILDSRVRASEPPPVVYGGFGFRFRRYPIPFHAAPYYGNRVIKVGVTYPRTFGISQVRVIRAYPFGYVRR